MSEHSDQYQPENEPFQRGQVIEGHVYDGIQEFDNPLPFWWVALFAISILFSIVYFIGIEVTGSIDTYEQDLAEGMEEIEALRMAAAGNAPEISEESLALIEQDPVNIASGETTYATSCSICHGMAGEGLIGPNLTDEHWIYGGSREDIFGIITNGAQNGMVAWEALISAEERANLVAYIYSLQGSNPPNAKAPEGEVWVAPVAEETTGDGTGETTGEMPADGENTPETPE